VRVQKVLSQAGVASRREAESAMLAGRVRVNGRVVTELGTRVDPAADRVELDGRVVRAERPRWILFHKPAGILTSRGDARGRRTIYDVLPRETHGLHYVGRLDKETAGLLLLTNDGDAANRLLHPSGEVEREYLAGVRGEPDQKTLRALTTGVELEDGRARAASARVVRREPEGTVLSVVLLEGRKREVRRLLEAVGHGVRWLRRVRFGPQRLGELAPGAWRELTPQEVRRLEQAPLRENVRAPRDSGSKGKPAR
jgi:23S rRNA pseudouridine2605 synthase